MGFSVDSSGRVVETESKTERKIRRESSYRETGILSIARVFGYMFIGLLITAIVAVGLGVLFRYLIFKGADISSLSDDTFDQTSVNATIGFLVVMIACGIGVLVMGIVLNISLYRGRSSLVAPAIIYTVLMGGLLSSFTLFIEWSVLGLAFGITAGTFGIMALIAFLSKGNLSGLAIAGIGLLIGALILSLVNWIIWLVSPTTWSVLYIAIQFIVLAAVMLITIYDMWRIKKIAERGEMNTNVELYCAFTLYVDFIYIFIRIVSVILASRR